MTADRYRKLIYYPALDRLKIKHRPPHTCRHTFATLLARAGVDILSIQRILGHSTYAFTADTYTHPDITQLKKAINKL
jgi:integrase/recombinase XerD